MAEIKRPTPNEDQLRRQKKYDEENEKRRAQTAPPPLPDHPVGRALAAVLTEKGHPIEFVIERLEAEERRKRDEAQNAKKGSKFDVAPDLECWTALTEEVKNIPVEVGVALMTGRHNLIAGMTDERKRSLTPEEIDGLLDLIRVLLATNAQLQRHCSNVAQMAEHAKEGIRSTLKHLNRLEAYAGFQGEPEEPEDGE